ncbi:substrate-binding domain-containing protein [Pseudaeromonas paramecii]|uniref:Autoinducer 2-binding periplasmic protein LuxP n=1 Tax=Pseudaeromonas paramecii TaxID=2138166 RepID=A0ABP8Q9U8_9GAMM
MGRKGAWLTGLLLWGLGLSVLGAEGLDEYWPLSQYQAMHPEQAQATQTLKRLVRNAPQPARLHQQGPMRIALISPGGQLSDYWRRNRLALERRLTQLGLDYQLQSYDKAPEQDERQQTQQLVTALAADPDYLIYTLDAQFQHKYIARLLSRGRPKVILQNITTPLKDWEARPPLLYVGFDHQQGSRLLADFFRRQAAGRPHFDYAMLYRSPGYVSTARGDTFIEQMRPQSNSQLRLAFYTQSDRASARQAALSALEQYPDLDLLFACATDTALGALDAIKQKGRQGKVQVNGWGGGSQELAALARGELAATVMRINDDTGVAVAEAIQRDLQGLPLPRVFAGDLVLVTPDTPKTVLQGLQARAFRYSDMEQE